MIQAYRLHYAPDNASLIIRLALEELGLAYQTALVDRATRAQDSAAYRNLNPHGLIPVLETPSGSIFETGAILLWLGDTHPSPLFPVAASPDRANALKWLFFISNTLHPALRMCFYSDKYIGPDPAMQAQLRRHMQSELRRHLDILERETQERGTEDVTVFDLYLACLLRWMALYPKDNTDWFTLPRWPALHGMCQRLERRASVHAAQTAEGLGAAPFSAPTYADPPRGTAT